MSPARPHAIVTAQGHLVDSQLLKSIFDRVIDRGGEFEVQHFELGRTNDDISRLTLKVSAADQATLARLVEDLIPFGCHAVGEKDAVVRAADKPGCAPEDFYSTTNQRTQVRIGGRWIDVEKQRMDAAIVLKDGRASCRKLRELSEGDQVVVGLEGIRVVPEFRERDRADFSFMSNEVSSERRVEASVARIAQTMRAVKKAGRKIVFVAGPVTPWRHTTPNSICSALHSAWTWKRARPCPAVTAITCARSMRSIAPGRSRQRSRPAS
jgi:hypothetical protein